MNKLIFALPFVVISHVYADTNIYINGKSYNTNCNQDNVQVIINNNVVTTRCSNQASEDPIKQDMIDIQQRKDKIKKQVEEKKKAIMKVINSLN